MDKEERPRRIKGWVISILIVLVGVVIGGIYTVNQPGYKVKQFVNAVNNQDFEKAYQLIYKDELLNDMPSQTIINYMEKSFDTNRFIKMDKPERINESHTYKVSTRFIEGERVQALTAIEAHGKWYIQNPFPVETVTIYAPIGANVSFEGQPLEPKENGVYKVEQVLPGKYTVQMSFQEGNVGDYVEVISVPQTTEVISPYQMMGVSVACPLNMTVKLGGEEKVNTEGVVNFPNRIEGSYTLEIKDAYGNVTPYSEEVMIDEGNRVFEVKDFKLSQQGIVSVQQFITSFYNNYLIGIKEGDYSFLYNYVEGANQEQIVDEFRQWYINDKNLIDATLLIELEQLYMDKEGKIHVTLLEVAELVNKEEDKPSKQGVYKVVTNWGLVLEPKDDQYKIIQKDLKQSIISYKDENGKWIAY